MYACIGACMYVCICLYVCLCICMHIHLYTRACGCTYALVQAHFVYLYCPLVTGVGGYVLAGVEIVVLSFIFSFFCGC